MGKNKGQEGEAGRPGFLTLSGKHHLWGEYHMKQMSFRS